MQAHDGKMHDAEDAMLKLRAVEDEAREAYHRAEDDARTKHPH